MTVAGLFQGLAQQKYVVGGTAAAAGLGDEQRKLIGVILAAFDGGQHLPDDEKRRIAGIVVHVF